MPIVNDAIDEVLEEGYIALIVFESDGADFPDLVDDEAPGQITLGRIADDDSKYAMHVIICCKFQCYYE